MLAEPPGTSAVNGMTDGMVGSGLPICTCVESLLTAFMVHDPVISAPVPSKTFTVALFGPTGTVTVLPGTVVIFLLLVTVRICRRLLASSVRKLLHHRQAISQCSWTMPARH